MGKTAIAGRGLPIREAAISLLCAALVAGCLGCASTSGDAGSADAAAGGPAASKVIEAEEDGAGERPLAYPSMTPLTPEELVGAHANPFLVWYALVPPLAADGAERAELVDALRIEERLPDDVAAALAEEGCGPLSRAVLLEEFSSLPSGYEPLKALIAQTADDELRAELAEACGPEELDALMSLHYDTPGDAFRDHLSRMWYADDLSAYDEAIDAVLEERGML